MKEPIWITKEILLAIQAALIGRFGGLGGISDEGLLDSALARRQQLFHYENPGPTEMEAVYAEGIVKNHPFIDGNKRARFMAAYTLLAANGWQLIAPEEEAVVFAFALAAGELDAAVYAAWLERSVEPKA